MTSRANGANVARFRPTDRMMRAEWIALAVALTKAARPVTPEGIRLLAEVAMVFADTINDENPTLAPPEHLYEWITLFALASAARTPEPVPLPLPHNLPRYWPPSDAT